MNLTPEKTLQEWHAECDFSRLASEYPDVRPFADRLEILIREVNWLRMRVTELETPPAPEVWQRHMLLHPEQVKDATFLAVLQSGFEMLNQLVDKNHDYGSSYKLGTVGVPAYKCLWVRLMDKVKRLEQLLAGNPAAVKSESVSDTLMDLAAYALLCRTMYGEENAP